MRFFILCSALSFGLSTAFTCQTTLAQSASIPAIRPVANIDEDDSIPDINESTTYEYRCEMNDVLNIYTNADDNNHIALHWKNRLYRLHRIMTTTGANRFENTKAGLVWIGIPTKGMLLDSRRGQQLANECKTAGQ